MVYKLCVITDDIVLNEKIIKALDLNYYNIKNFVYSSNIISEITSFNPDIIIVDMLSISKNFFELMNLLKQDALLSEKKIIVLSQSKKIDIIIGPTPKIRGYISKPIDFNELKQILDRNVDSESMVAVVDDDTEFLDLIKIFLESNNYKPLLINDSKVAYQVIKYKKPSLVILDIMMPDKDGFDVMMELYEDHMTKDIPIVAISAIGFNRFLEKGGISGNPEYVSRDISSDFIKEIIENTISNSYGYASEKTKVLIADDQIELLSLLRESLEKSGFIVFSAVDGKEAIEKIFQFNPDIVVLDYNMPFKNGLEVASEIKNNPIYSHIPVIIVTARTEKEAKIKGLMMGIDDYITKPVDNDELIARIRMIIKRNKQVLDTNPLSKLPGNPSIQAIIEKAIGMKEKFAVLYVDLNNFKAYNDVYGFEKGDSVIKTLANILVKVVMPKANTLDFVGHIGGDDFIVITDANKAEDIAKKIISNFDQIVPSFYNETDRKKGFIKTKDRQGKIVEFPLLGVSIGIVHNLYKPLSSYAQISHIGSELKKAAKSYNQSTYVIDKRRE